MTGDCYELQIHCNTHNSIVPYGIFFRTWIYTQMSKKPLNISEEAAVQMPMKTVASLIAMIAVGTWAYFGIHEKLNQHSTKIELMTKDLEQNSEFRIKYPRGELGQSSGEAELFMLVEHLAGVLEDIEKLKDANREIGYKNGSYTQ